MDPVEQAGRGSAAAAFPYAFHIALDGNGLNGLEGRAGVCVFGYDPVSGRHASRIEYYDGLAGGHAITLSPDRRLGFLGNTGQHLAFYDTERPEDTERVSTLRFEPTDSSIKGSTHAVWLDGSTGITAVGESFWQFDVNHLTAAENIGAHDLKLPHAIKRTASGRHLVYGGMDHPRRGEACEVGIFDLHYRTTRTVELPATCWHVATHPTEDRFYALSFRVVPQEGRDWHEWAMAHFKEYAFEIDADTGQVLRHWTAASDIPAHINSDVCISDRELIYCTGGSNTIVLIDLADFSSYRIIDQRPDMRQQVKAGRQATRQVLDALTRGSALASTKHFLAALRVSRGTLIDGVYACQLSADQTLLFTANRGLNTITVYDYPACTVRTRVRMPDLHDHIDGLRVWSDPRLGFHHGALISPQDHH
ncbi:hypothetical protein [Actinokineospora sp. NBRC 105648]|uniref:hypothetical protein n=1 Tax=Actinokineospora sp. NBRC 105648 TaxID=3032206 RepID=UPI0024A0EA04|nr:hypothetical protein [Actinokineospora sp. NBRC 105648]GLZ37917.1 hypothetical protein Acsp05_15410 [Actinokineospora sp. NBRC 105648]